MNIYASINEENIVTGIAQLANPVDAEEYISISAFDKSLVGKQWNGSEFIDGPPPPTPVKSWDELQLKREFTQAERLAIRTARLTDPVVDDVMDLLEATTRSGGRVMADDSDLIAGLNYMESVGLLAAGRANEVLSG